MNNIYISVILPAMPNLDKYRDEIDRIDREILRLLNERAGNAIAIGEIKKKEGKPLWVPSREMKIYERLTELNDGPFPNDALRNVYREIISASLSLEEIQKVAFLGPEGTFTNLAAIKHFGLSAKLLPLRNIPEVFEEVTKERCSYGVVPVENSLEGVVNHTLDMFIENEINVCGEIYISVSHHLLNRSGEKSDIRRVYSHPQAIAQCRNWISKNLPDVQVNEVDSTAKAAEMAMNDESSAAIASEMAEMCYRLRAVERNIEDSAKNFTRFLIIGDFEPLPTGNDKTSIVFSLSHQSGTLYKALELFAKSGVNLTKIESRPSKVKAWEYFFFVDVDGHKDNDDIKKCMEELVENVSFFKMLGSYPKGEK